MSFQEYLKLMFATKSIISKRKNSQVYLDFTRAERSRTVYELIHTNKIVPKEKLYDPLLNAINSFSAFELNLREYERLYKIYGDAIVKVCLVDQNLKKWLNKSSSTERILGSGGSCALESIDTILIRKIKNRKTPDKLIEKYINCLLDVFPTWTQITGSLTPINGITIMYDETYPWFHKIEKYGIKNAEILTQRAYDSIYRSVSRFAKLINPNNIILKVPFTELNLAKGGQLEKWFYLYEPILRNIETDFELNKLDFVENDFVRAWVEYTYSGPEILNINKKVIKKLYKDIFYENNINDCSIHTRSKQIDHLTVERGSKWIYEVLIDKNIDKENNKRYKTLLNLPSHRHELAIFSWIINNFEKNSQVGFSGFLDFNYQGDFLHETPFVSSNELASVSDNNLIDFLYSSPLRLHTKNVQKVIDFLSHFKQPNTINFSREILNSFIRKKIKVDKLTQKIKSIKKFILISNVMIEMLNNISHSKEENNIYISIPYKHKIEFIENIDFLWDRYRSNRELIQHKKTILSNLNPEKFEMDFKFLIKDINFENNLIDKKISIIFHEEIHYLKFFLINLFKKNIQSDLSKLLDIDKEISILNKDLNFCINKIGSDILEQKMDPLIKSVNILPLCDNLFVSYMQQLLFIPKVRDTYIKMSEIENSNLSTVNKEEIIIDLTNKIFYIVVECIKYVMNENESYPWKIRFENE